MKKKIIPAIAAVLVITLSVPGCVVFPENLDTEAQETEEPGTEEQGSEEKYEATNETLEFNFLSDEEYEALSQNEKAVYTAQKYSLQFLSEEEIRDCLYNEWFEQDEIDYAIENCNIDWIVMASGRAKEHIDRNPDITKTSLMNQLIFDGFTYEQASQGSDVIDTANASDDHVQEAIDAIAEEVERCSYSKESTYEILVNRYDYDKSIASQAVDNMDVDWKENALIQAKQWVDPESNTSGEYSEEEIRTDLESGGFTEEEIEYALENYLK